MDVSRRRAGVKTSVVAGSVWESRMKHDEVKGGIKVFNGEENVEESRSSNGDTARKIVKGGGGQTGISNGVAVSGKRKTWKSEIFEGPIQIAKGKTSEVQCKELSVSVDGIRKSPVQARKGRSEGSNKELNLSVDGIDESFIQVEKVSKELDGSPIQVKKGSSEANREVDENEKSPSQTRKQRSDLSEDFEYDVELRKVKSDSVKVSKQSGIGKDPVPDGGDERNSVQLRKAKSEPEKLLNESVNRIEKSPPEIEEIGSEETCEEFGMCQEKVISSSENNELIKKPAPKLWVYNPPPGDDEFEGDEEEEEIEIEIEKKTLVIKEMKIPEERPKKVETNVAEQKPRRVEVGTPQHKPKKVEVSTPGQKPKKVEFSTPEEKPKKVVSEVKKIERFNNRTAPTSSDVNKQPPPVLRRATLYQNLAKAAATPFANEYHSFKENRRHSKLQNLVDLVMWRDLPRSALAFGMGTFIIISSSYSKDLNVSFISVMSYLGLVYLATIFLYRSLICRGVIDIDDDRSYVVGEGEAIWLLKLVLPYLNECLLKIRALFSGDPSTTMKMAVLLFVLARCGSSITIWKMAKLGFFGVFIVPKVCYSYSTQLTAYGKFWIRRFRDAWESCSHKKAVALGIFSLVWHLSSMVARIWAVFMMFVAVRYYQQTMERYDWVEEEDAEADETWHGDSGGQRQGSGPASIDVNEMKKGS
ncbi:PREDICTED: reticulon-like protein B21 isoform X2 [Populus euphratica]|uniref:Reticulon-like protein B21 isoform X2 n=1 Tax=Populus euphratica TaxID=75702 RepID=A0AAJ6UQE5_POPEU|nr:PREDICTED: reticulon-like protein B21 isoform X2 [Populus euphratica]